MTRRGPAAAALLALVLAASAAAAEPAFRVRLERGVSQTRPTDGPGIAALSVLRLLPPEREPWTFFVEIPHRWLDAAPASSAPGDARRRTLAPGGEGEALLEALRAAGRLSAAPGPVLAAALRNAAPDGGAPQPVDDRIAPLWEALATPDAVDTLDAAFHVLVLLERLGVPGALVRYPTVGTAQFGVAVREATPDCAPWPAGAGECLLVMHPHAAPAAGAGERWALEEVLAPGWAVGAPAPASAVAPPRAPVRPDRRPDVCAQARALGLACEPVGAAALPWSLMIAAVALGLGAAGVTAWRTRARRRRLAAERAEKARAARF